MLCREDAAWLSCAEAEQKEHSSYTLRTMVGFQEEFEGLVLFLYHEAVCKATLSSFC